MIKKASLFVLLLFLVLSFGSAQASAYFTDADGINHYGWTVIATEDNQSSFEFGEDGNLSYVWAAEGDIANQRVNMYALRELPIDADETYSVEGTFVPDSETDLSVERTYGLVVWYLDADNYLLYWMQQKVAGDWSGQFYGRVNGIFKKYVTNFQQLGDEDYWHSGEYNDMWWDNANYAHPTILRQASALCSTTITLKVVSEIVTTTVDGQEWTGRKFELHQIIDGVDFIPSVYYVKDVQEKGDGFLTGVYSEAFNFGVENFTVTAETDYAADVEAEINALGTVDSQEDINAVMNARANYEGLLDLKENVEAMAVTALENAEAAAGAYVDTLILALDKTKVTFVEDVNAVYELYGGLSDEIISHITKTAELSTAVNDAKDWELPNEEDPDDKEDPKTEKKGCFGAIGFGGVSIFILIIIGAFIFLRKRNQLTENK